MLQLTVVCNVSSYGPCHTFTSLLLYTALPGLSWISSRWSDTEGHISRSVHAYVLEWLALSVFVENRLLVHRLSQAVKFSS